MKDYSIQREPPLVQLLRHLSERRSHYSIGGLDALHDLGLPLEEAFAPTKVFFDSLLSYGPACLHFTVYPEPHESPNWEQFSAMHVYGAGSSTQFPTSVFVTEGFSADLEIGVRTLRTPHLEPTTERIIQAILEDTFAVYFQYDAGPDDAAEFLRSLERQLWATVDPKDIQFERIWIEMVLTGFAGIAFTVADGDVVHALLRPAARTDALFGAVEAAAGALEAGIRKHLGLESLSWNSDEWRLTLTERNNDEPRH